MKKILLGLILFILCITSYLFFSFNRFTPAASDLKADKIVVVKSQRKMFLYHQNELIKIYRIALGADPIGHKMKEGDEKTPEGLYYLDYRNPQSSCYKSFHISYPNKRDKETAAKNKVSPGGYVMVHGLHPSIKWMGRFHIINDWTNGCIAVSNQEMDELWTIVDDHTPIEIH